MQEKQECFVVYMGDPDLCTVFTDWREAILFYLSDSQEHIYRMLEYDENEEVEALYKKLYENPYEEEELYELYKLCETFWSDYGNHGSENCGIYSSTLYSTSMGV